MSKNKIIYVIIVLLCSNVLRNKLYSQTNSINNELAAAKSDTAKANVYLKNADLLFRENPTKSFEYVKKGSFISKQLKFEPGIAKSYYILGNIYDNISLDTSYYYYKESLNLELKLRDNSQIAKLFTCLGTHFQKKKNPKFALGYYFKAVKIYEIIKDENGLAQCYMGIGNVFISKNNSKRALHFYNQSIDSYKKTKSKKIAAPMANAAIIYNQLGEIKKSKEMFLQALTISMNNKDFYYGAYIKDEIGDIFFKERKYQKALNYFLESLNIKRDKKFSKEMFANSYNHIANVYLAINNNKKALMYIDSLEPIVYKLNSNNLKIYFLDSKIRYYKNIDDYKNAYKYLSYYNQLQDSLSTDEMHKQMAEADAKHSAEKKEKEIDLLNKDNLIQKIKLAENLKQRNAFIIGIIFLTILIIIIYIGYSQKQKANKLITQQKKELESQKQKVVMQKSIIEQQQKDTIDSINYAKRIQYTLLANNSFFQNKLHSHFIFFKPKDIVSGDFYWATESNGFFYLAVCDSTGHGVPGAFMSLLNTRYLSEAINEKNITAPNEILNFARKRLIENIGSDGNQDGMDCILICINFESKIMLYASANNELILIRDNKLIELSKDKMPVGHSSKNESFNLYEQKLQTNDLLYLYTDGYADQFGGPKGKKYMKKQLNNMLLSNSHLSLELQKEKIHNNLTTWQGELEQVDDICIIAIKI